MAGKSTLLRRFGGGDDDALNELLKVLRSKVREQVKALGRKCTDEVENEILWRLVKALRVRRARLDAEFRNKIEDFLFGITKNVLKIPGAPAMRMEPLPEGGAGEPVGRQSSPSEHAIKEEARGLLWDRIALLAPHYQEVLKLHLNERLGPEEIAEKLGIKSVQVVYKRLERAKALLHGETVGFASSIRIRRTE